MFVSLRVLGNRSTDSGGTHLFSLQKSTSSDEEHSDFRDNDDHGLDAITSTLRTPVRSLTGHSNVVMAAEWLPGGEQIITASWDRTASLYDVETGDLLQSLSGIDSLIHSTLSDVRGQLYADRKIDSLNQSNFSPQVTIRK